MGDVALADGRHRKSTPDMSLSRILRSSVLMGGAQVVVLLAGFARTKVIALVLGASGVGLVGLFNTFSGNLASLSGWGLGISGVRLVAGAAEEEKPRKAAAVRRLGAWLSWTGLSLALVLFWPVTGWTFASHDHALELAVVGLAVPCLVAAGTWTALLQADGKIGSLALVQVAGALAGVILGLPLVYLYGSIGIAASIFLAAAVPAALLWQAARKHCPARPGLTADPGDLRDLLRLGGALMLVGWVSQLSAYLVRLTIIRAEGLDAAGYYHAAFAIAGSLPGFVFAAMGADFFPRVAAADGEEAALRITEKQILVGVMLATPLIGVLLLFGGDILALLFAESFFPAKQPLVWLTWGIFVRLIAWPFGYWLVARSSSKAVVAIECGAAVALVGCQSSLTAVAGLAGAGMGFLLGYVAYAVALILFARRRSGRWLSRKCGLFLLATTALLLGAQAAAAAAPGALVRIAAIVALAGWSAVSYRVMKNHEG